MTGSWVVVIPVKGTPGAKSRLGGSEQLALAIALDTVAAAVDVADVIVVTSQAAAPLFVELGARTCADPGGGLGAAVAAGIAFAGVGDPDLPIAVLLGDLPALTPFALVNALTMAEGHPLAMVADADNSGTVLITALSRATHSPAFGHDSRAAHRAAGYTELNVAETSVLRRDVDTAVQLHSLSRAVLGPRTRGLLGP